jgi:hypothetical protein
VKRVLFFLYGSLWVAVVAGGALKITVSQSWQKTPPSTAVVIATAIKPAVEGAEPWNGPEIMRYACDIEDEEDAAMEQLEAIVAKEVSEKEAKFQRKGI